MGLLPGDCIRSPCLRPQPVDGAEEPNGPKPSLGFGQEQHENCSELGGQGTQCLHDGEDDSQCL
eukprot:11921619-Heterocapsa_arctica.AAC.1